VTSRVLEFSDVAKGFGGLRPLRIGSLTVDAGERIAIVGLDRVSAEVFVNLATGASLPDRGEVVLLGQPSHTIRDSAGWLSLVDRVGIVSRRIVLLEGLSVVQNLAIPFSLDVEPLAESLRERAAAAAREVALAEGDWDRRAGDVEGSARVRIWLARALAFDPALVLFEHPTADVPPGEAVALGRSIDAALERRGAAAVLLTGDRAFASAVASRVLTVDPATGTLSERKPRWFG
jgi:ABC-type transporter Mla maintaining outer membrane lipid asymmetry ATPase subunit MlaF